MQSEDKSSMIVNNDNIIINNANDLFLSFLLQFLSHMYPVWKFSFHDLYADDLRFHKRKQNLIKLDKMKK